MDKTELNKIATHPLQTSFWGEFREEWGNEVLHTKCGLLTIHRLPFTHYRIGMFIKGPKPTKVMLEDLKKIAKKNNLIFIKLEPNVVVKILNSKSKILNKSQAPKSKFQTNHKSQVTSHHLKVLKLLKENGAVPGKTLFTPTTFQIDLTKPEEEMMSEFHSKTRYNIRYAKRKGVEVVEDNSDEAFEKYLELMRETVERQGFYAHTEKYHRLMWKHLHQSPVTSHQSPIAHLLTAKHKGEVLTAWIIFVWKDFLYYPYGASSMKYKNVQANSLMMWEAIRFGKKHDLKTFDLWGREPGEGFTKFKEGFNPQVVEFLGTWDVVYNKPLYKVYRIAETFRWMFLKTRSRFSPKGDRF